VTTGDDAIELAVDRARHEGELGGAVGVNVRIADYSALTNATAAGVSAAVHAAARRLGAPLRAIAISTVPGEEDGLALARLFGVVDGASDVAVPGLDDVMAAIADCRVVVTGSYHAAVLALSMGVSAVGLAASQYYEDKFLGLAQQFGVGCDVVLLEGRAGGTDEIDEIIERAWDRAPHVRPALCAAAAEQVVRSHRAYDRIADIVDGGRRPDRTCPGAPVTVCYGSWRLGAATFYRQLRARSDVSRWSSLDSFDPSWGSRAELIAELVPEGSRVIEFGAGRRQLEALLPHGCTYIPSDLVDRGPGTLVVDLDDRPLPDLARLAPDLAVFAGVFEYLHHFADIPRWLAAQVPTCIASYECASSRAGTFARLRERSARLRNGWATTYTERELVDLFVAAGWDCSERRTWTTPDGDERIFVFECT
jgi:hypothetical protein